ncbi:N-acetyltransferase [Salibacteraceae bacterium]|jgi:acetyltransferase-like isoleucine patch superfamily enzyme|nr:UDP-3-O-(3-hydroxymyristoyl)glucosamine N-acyltransferase [Crocinitomicaceae bacterium]MDA9968290.1 N-acetyltransferase [Salibacteraceae bacterium]|tara:strand:- start:159409 stop:159873 length:465 start_codon:yes stop_codon:yes gene_type:complete
MLNKTLHIGIRGDVEFGENVVVVEPVNLYGCSIGDDSFIGPFVEIQKGAKVGSKTKIQSHSFICDLVSIGDGCFVGHGVMFINDLFQEGKPAGGNTKLYKRTQIGNNVSIGSNATILPVSVADGSVIAAGAVVIKDIVIKGVYVGNPAKLIKQL